MKLYEFLTIIEAVHQMHIGHIDIGLNILDHSEGADTLKNLAKAEVAYWREEYRDALYYDEHSLANNYEWKDPFALPNHLRAYVIAAKSLGCISRAKEFLDYFIAKQRKEYSPKDIQPFINLYDNAMLRLDNKIANDEPCDINIYNESNAPSKFIFYDNGDENSLPKEAASVSRILLMMWNKVPTMPILELYEKYAENIQLDDNHIMAARTYIKIGANKLFEKAITRIVSNWVPHDDFEVMPMKLFIYHDIISNMTKDFKQQLLSMIKIKAMTKKVNYDNI